MGTHLYKRRLCLCKLASCVHYHICRCIERDINLTRKYRTSCANNLQNFKFSLPDKRKQFLPHMAVSRMNATKPLPVTEETIFSAANIHSAQERLLTVLPVRAMPWGQHLPQAAVLVPLCTVGGIPSVLFTVRSEHLTHHKGEVSFPGGKQDKTDTHLVHTALREMEEELGMSPEELDVWGQMAPVPGKNLKIAVTPVLAFCGEINVDQLHFNEDEVTSAFTRTITSLCDPVNQRYTRYRTGAGYSLPVYLGGERRIWGLTAVILHQALTLIAPGMYNFKIQLKR